MSEASSESNSTVPGLDAAVPEPHSNNAHVTNVPVKNEPMKTSQCETCPTKASEDSSKFFPTLCMPSQKVQNEQTWVLPKSCAPVISETAIKSGETTSVDTASEQNHGSHQNKIKKEAEESLSTCDVTQLVFSRFLVQSAQGKDQKPQPMDFDSQAIPQVCNNPTGTQSHIK